MSLSHVLHSRVRPDTRFWPITWLLIRIAWFLIVIQLVEIVVGHVLLVGEMSARHRVVVLLFGGDLRHHRVGRSRLAERVANAWPN